MISWMVKNSCIVDVWVIMKNYKWKWLPFQNIKKNKNNMQIAPFGMFWVKQMILNANMWLYLVKRLAIKHSWIEKHDT